MARANPLMQRRPLPPVAEDTQSDFIKRMAVASSFGRTAAPGPEMAAALSKGRGGGNAVKITVDPEDKLPSDYAENKEPYENIAFGIFKQDPALISTLVENMHTGGFHSILNNQLQIEDEEAKPLDSIGPNEMETAVYDRLIRWSRRIHKLFLMVQGLLAGLCMLHLYLLLDDTSDSELFVAAYARYTRVIATFFHALVLIALLGALHRTLSERTHCEH